MNEFDLNQVKILFKQVQLAYDKIVYLNQRKEIILECCDNISQTILKFKVVYLYIEYYDNYIGYIINYKNRFIDYNNRIFSIVYKISEIDKQICEVNENIIQRQIAIAENEKFYTWYHKVVCRNNEAF